MAVTSSIPPQAYTRDTLVKAIEWMNTQSQALRERASSADLIVSYYLQACRKTAVQMEAPVSQESFKQDLRHLAEDLKQFEEPSAPPPHIQPARSFSGVEPLFGNPEPPIHYHYIPPHQQQHQHAPPPPLQPAPQPKPPSAQWTIDPKSLAMAREVQNKLNLSCEREALRMLIALGAERARQLFP